MITIGIDPHKTSLTAVAIGPSAEPAATMRMPVTAATAERLQEWASQWPQRQWAVEGASGLGRGLAQALAAAGEYVVDVPAQLAARARVLNSGHARKTDAIDATSVAVVAVHHPRLRQVQPEGHNVILRLLSDRRDELAEERTRTVNRLHALLRELVPGGAKRNLTTHEAATVLRQVRPLTTVDEQRKALARDLLADLRRLDRAIAGNTEQLQAAVADSGTSLTEMHGVGPVLAAKILVIPAIFIASRLATISRATAAPPRSRPPAENTGGTGSPAPATGSSTVPCTSLPSVRSALQARVRTTTSRNSPKTRHQPKHDEH